MAMNNASTTAYAASLVIKNEGGSLVGLTGYNSSAADNNQLSLWK